MHALGLWHEQSRPDRDSYIQVNYGNIPAQWQSQFDTRGIAFGPYDFDSVMHYSACAFSTCSPCSTTDPNCRTMTALPGYEQHQGTMGQLNGLSTGDHEVLTMMYGPAFAPNADNRSGAVSAQSRRRSAARTRSRTRTTSIQATSSCLSRATSS